MLRAGPAANTHWLTFESCEPCTVHYLILSIMRIGGDSCFEHFIVMLIHKPNWKCRKKSPDLTCSLYNWTAKTDFQDQQNQSPLTLLSKTLNLSPKYNKLWVKKNIFKGSRYPRVRNGVPRYPKIVPRDQNFCLPKFPIKLWDFFILCNFHNSKLFWLRHATFKQKKIPSVQWWGWHLPNKLRTSKIKRVNDY